MSSLKQNLPAHGGNLQWAQQHFGGAQAQWLDISTGISPWAWPLPELPAHIWQRLPESDASLRQQAALYYRCAPECVLPVPGSQFAIHHVPRLLPPASVAVPQPGYHEHAIAWRNAGHELILYKNLPQLDALLSSGDVQHAVVINPNNPTAEIANAAQLRKWAGQLQQRDGTLVVDEAFMDATPDNSLTSDISPASVNDNLLVLRSFGKFFGLAGVRLGFVIAQPKWLARLRTQCTLWQISHPAQWFGERALADRAWQQNQSRRIQHQAEQLQSLLQQRWPSAHINSTAFFVTLENTQGDLFLIFNQLAHNKILTRYGCTANAGEWLRFGLPGENWLRLQTSLMSIG